MSNRMSRLRTLFLYSVNNFAGVEEKAVQGPTRLGFFLGAQVLLSLQFRKMIMHSGTKTVHHQRCTYLWENPALVSQCQLLVIQLSELQNRCGMSHKSIFATHIDPHLNLEVCKILMDGESGSILELHKN